MIGQKIFYFRKSNGLTQEQLAHGICSVPHLSKIENGHETPSTDILEHLCKRLAISISDIDNKADLESISTYLDEWYLLILSRDKEASVQMYPLIEKQMMHVQDPDLLIRHKLFTLRLKLLLRDLDEASSILLNFESFIKSLHSDLEYYYYMFRGLYEYMVADFFKALHSFTIAESTADRLRIKDPELYYLLALVNSKLHRTYFSINYANVALELYDESCNYLRSIDCQIILGININRTHNYLQAEKHLLNALQVSKTLKDNERISAIYHNLGFVFSTQDNHQKAIEYYSKSLDYDSDHEIKTRTYYSLAQSCLKVKDFKTVKRCIEKGNILAKKGDLKEYILHFTVLHYQINTDCDSQLEELLKNEAIPYFKEKQMWQKVADYGELLAEIYSKQFKYKSSCQYYSLVNESRNKIYKYI
jgi:transcriptional regulator with XRE-family HTH domain/Tfp pilus assembly protein PilF